LEENVLERRALIGFAAGAVATLINGAAFAQGAAAWDSTWVGTTQRGGAVQVTVSGGRPASYVFRGQPVPITGASVSGNSMTINVNGGIPGTVKITRGMGNAVSYSYSDTGGGTAAATLTKQ
jgi:hypothetical protein